MADSTAIRCVTFGDICSIIQNRGQIAGDAQDRDLNFIKGSVNEHYIRIATERDWYWRKKDRDLLFQVPVTTGTVSVTNLSRAITFTGLTLDLTYKDRSIKIVGDNTLYRIIGLDIATNTAYLAAPYAWVTNAAAQFKIFNYEMALPPDCDEIVQIYYDFPINGYCGGSRQVDAVDPLVFNRNLSSYIDYVSPPVCFTRDGRISAETLPPLDVMVLDYDFLGGDEFAEVDRVRFFPIAPDINRVLHMNYSVHVEDLAEPEDVPIIPIDDRWILIHFVLADWFRIRGQTTVADREYGIAKKMLDEMRAEYRSTDAKPKFKTALSRFSRYGYYNDKDDLFWISRRLEY